MPQLPSGRHVGLDISPLDALWRDALQAQRVHHLMDITTAEDLLPFVNVIYFRESSAAEDLSESLHERSGQVPSQMEPYPSGFDLATLPLEEFHRWSPEDREAFGAFLKRATENGFFKDALANVERMKKDVAANGNEQARLLCSWWRMGVHPLQPGGDQG